MKYAPPTPIHIPTPGWYTAGTVRGLHCLPTARPLMLRCLQMSCPALRATKCFHLLFVPGQHTLLPSTPTRPMPAQRGAPYRCVSAGVTSKSTNQRVPQPSTLSLRTLFLFLQPTVPSWFSSVVSTRLQILYTDPQYLYSAA